MKYILPKRKLFITQPNNREVLIYLVFTLVTFTKLGLVCHTDCY